MNKPSTYRYRNIFNIARARVTRPGWALIPCGHHASEVSCLESFIVPSNQAWQTINDKLQNGWKAYRSTHDRVRIFCPFHANRKRKDDLQLYIGNIPPPPISLKSKEIQEHGEISKRKHPRSNGESNPQGNRKKSHRSLASLSQRIIQKRNEKRKQPKQS